MTVRLPLWPALALLLAAAAPAQAAVFQVNQLNDRPDADLTDHVCDTDLTTPDRQCSLRAAIQEANQTPGPVVDQIDLAPFGNNSSGSFTYELTIQGAGEDDAATGDLDIKTPVEISSDLLGGSFNTTFIDAKKLKDRIFDVKPGGSLDLRRVSLLSGRTAKGESDPGTPGVVTGGCIRSEDTVLLRDVFLFRCQSDFDGGALSVIAGTADIAASVFSTNKAKGAGGGLLLKTGSSGTLVNSTAGANKAGSGGAIAAFGDLALTGVTIDGNGAKLGGGIAVLGPGTVTIDGSTIAQNGKSNLDTTQSTGSVAVSSSIVWGAKTDCVGPVTSAGGNLEGATACGFASTNDQQSQDPQLAPLNFYGGLVPTRTLASTSPAIDHGLDGGSVCTNTDARGRLRAQVLTPGVALTDSGSSEFSGQPLNGLTITSSPVTRATVGVAYSYAVSDRGVCRTFALLVAPSGMSIDTDTGLITWTPTGGQTGQQDVTVQATDVASVTPLLQSFTIQVSAAAP